MDNRKCVKCTLDEADKIFPCDCCKLFLCVKCAGLTASEVACLRLKNGRKLIFLCDKCENGLWRIPDLIKEVHELKESIKNIENKVEKAETMEQNLNSESINFNHEQFINEISERQKRASNVIILNVNESNKAVRSQRIADDKSAVEQILQDIDIGLQDIKVFRLGKFQPNRIRPLKVCFLTNNEALMVLRNKKSLTVPNVKIFADQTKSQREYFNKVKNQLEECKRRGEQKIIKYINNVPTLVNPRKEKN